MNFIRQLVISYISQSITKKQSNIPWVEESYSYLHHMMDQISQSLRALQFNYFFKQNIQKQQLNDYIYTSVRQILQRCFQLSKQTPDFWSQFPLSLKKFQNLFNHIAQENNFANFINLISTDADIVTALAEIQTDNIFTNTHNFITSWNMIKGKIKTSKFSQRLMNNIAQFKNQYIKYNFQDDKIQKFASQFNLLKNSYQHKVRNAGRAQRQVLRRQHQAKLAFLYSQLRGTPSIFQSQQDFQKRGQITVKYRKLLMEKGVDSQQANQKAIKWYFENYVHLSQGWIPKYQFTKQMLYKKLILLDKFIQQNETFSNLPVLFQTAQKARKLDIKKMAQKQSKLLINKPFVNQKGQFQGTQQQNYYGGRYYVLNKIIDHLTQNKLPPTSQQISKYFDKQQQQQLRGVIRKFQGSLKHHRSQKQKKDWIQNKQLQMLSSMKNTQQKRKVPQNQTESQQQQIEQQGQQFQSQDQSLFRYTNRLKGQIARLQKQIEKRKIHLANRASQASHSRRRQRYKQQLKKPKHMQRQFSRSRSRSRQKIGSRKLPASRQQYMKFDVNGELKNLQQTKNKKQAQLRALYRKQTNQQTKQQKWLQFVNAAQQQGYNEQDITDFSSGYLNNFNVQRLATQASKQNKTSNYFASLTGGHALGQSTDKQQQQQYQRFVRAVSSGQPINFIYHDGVNHYISAVYQPTQDHIILLDTFQARDPITNQLKNSNSQNNRIVQQFRKSVYYRALMQSLKGFDKKIPQVTRRVVLQQAQSQCGILAAILPYYSIDYLRKGIQKDPRFARSLMSKILLKKQNPGPQFYKWYRQVYLRDPQVKKKHNMKRFNNLLKQIQNNNSAQRKLVSDMLIHSQLNQQQKVKQAKKSLQNLSQTKKRLEKQILILSRQGNININLQLSQNDKKMKQLKQRQQKQKNQLKLEKQQLKLTLQQNKNKNDEQVKKKQQVINILISQLQDQKKKMQQLKNQRNVVVNIANQRNKQMVVLMQNVVNSMVATEQKARQQYQQMYMNSLSQFNPQIQYENARKQVEKIRAQKQQLQRKYQEKQWQLVQNIQNTQKTIQYYNNKLGDLMDQFQLQNQMIKQKANQFEKREKILLQSQTKYKQQYVYLQSLYDKKMSQYDVKSYEKTKLIWKLQQVNNQFKKEVQYLQKTVQQFKNKPGQQAIEQTVENLYNQYKKQTVMIQKNIREKLTQQYEQILSFQVQDYRDKLKNAKQQYSQLSKQYKQMSKQAQQAMQQVKQYKKKLATAQVRLSQTKISKSVRIQNLKKQLEQNKREYQRKLQQIEKQVQQNKSNFQAQKTKQLTDWMQLQMQKFRRNNAKAQAKSDILLAHQVTEVKKKIQVLKKDWKQQGRFRYMTSYQSQSIRKLQQLAELQSKMLHQDMHQKLEQHKKKMQPTILGVSISDWYQKYNMKSQQVQILTSKMKHFNQIHQRQIQNMQKLTKAKIQNAMKAQQAQMQRFIQAKNSQMQKKSLSEKQTKQKSQQERFNKKMREQIQKQMIEIQKIKQNQIIHYQQAYQQKNSIWSDLVRIKNVHPQEQHVQIAIQTVGILRQLDEAKAQALKNNQQQNQQIRKDFNQKWQNFREKRIRQFFKQVQQNKTKKKQNFQSQIFNLQIQLKNHKDLLQKQYRQRMRQSQQNFQIQTKQISQNILQQLKAKHMEEINNLRRQYQQQGQNMRRMILMNTQQSKRMNKQHQQKMRLITAEKQQQIKQLKRKQAQQKDQQQRLNEAILIPLRQQLQILRKKKMEIEVQNKSISFQSSSLKKDLQQQKMKNMKTIQEMNNKFATQSQKQKQKYKKQLEDIKLQNQNQRNDLKKKQKQLQMRQKELQQQKQTKKQFRDMFNKQYQQNIRLESLNQQMAQKIQEMRQKNKKQQQKVNHQIKNLKAQIRSKEQIIFKQKMTLQKLNKQSLNQKQLHSQQIKKSQDSLKQARSDIKLKQQIIENRQKSIMQQKQKIQNMTKDLDTSRKQLKKKQQQLSKKQKQILQQKEKKKQFKTMFQKQIEQNIQLDGINQALQNKLNQIQQKQQKGRVQLLKIKQSYAKQKNYTKKKFDQQINRIRDQNKKQKQELRKQMSVQVQRQIKAQKQQKKKQISEIINRYQKKIRDTQKQQQKKKKIRQLQQQIQKKQKQWQSAVKKKQQLGLGKNKQKIKKIFLESEAKHKKQINQLVDKLKQMRQQEIYQQQDQQHEMLKKISQLQDQQQDSQFYQYLQQQNRHKQQMARKFPILYSMKQIDKQKFLSLNSSILRKQDYQQRYAMMLQQKKKKQQKIDEKMQQAVKKVNHWANIKKAKQSKKTRTILKQFNRKPNLRIFTSLKNLLSLRSSKRVKWAIQRQLIQKLRKQKDNMSISQSMRIQDVLGPVMNTILQFFDQKKKFSKWQLKGRMQNVLHQIGHYKQRYLKTKIQNLVDRNSEAKAQRYKNIAKRIWVRFGKSILPYLKEQNLQQIRLQGTNLFNLLWQNQLSPLIQYSQQRKRMKKKKNFIMQVVLGHQNQLFHQSLMNINQIPIRRIEIEYNRQNKSIQQETAKQFKQLMQRILGNIKQQRQNLDHFMSYFKEIDPLIMQAWDSTTSQNFTIRLQISPHQQSSAFINIPITLNHGSDIRQIMKKLEAAIKNIMFLNQDYQNYVVWYVNKVTVTGKPGLLMLVQLLQQSGHSDIAQILRQRVQLKSRINSQHQLLQYTRSFNDKYNCWQNVVHFLQVRYGKMQQKKSQIQTIKKYCQQNGIGLIVGQKVHFQSQTHTVVVIKRQKQNNKLVIRDHVFITGSTQLYLSMSQVNNKNEVMRVRVPFKDPKKLTNRASIFLDIQAFGDEKTQYRQYAQTQRMYMVSLLVYHQSQCIDEAVFSLNPFSVQTQQYQRQTLQLRFAQYFRETIESYDAIWTVWAYNGINYDYQYILPILLEHQFPQAQVLGNKNSPKGFIITTEQSIIRFLDTKTIITSGRLQDNAQKYNKLWKKLDFQISRINNMQQLGRHYQQVIKYNQYDCYSMMQLIVNHYNTLWQYAMKMARKYGRVKNINKQDFMLKFTIPSISYYIFQKIFLGDSVLPDDQLLQTHRENYFGGCTQVWRHTTSQPLYQLDINAQYPSVMKFDAPPIYKIRHRYEINQQQQIQLIKQAKKDNTFYKIQKFRLLPDSACTIAYPTGTSLLYLSSYQNQQKKKWMWGIQIKQHVKRGCFFLISQAIDYSDTNPLSTKKWTSFYDYVSQAYEYRLQSKRNQNKLMQAICKNLQNSLYGKLAQKKFKGLKLRWNRGYQYQQKQQQQEQNPKFHVGNFVRLSSFITASARSLLNKYIYTVGTQNVWYMDTDSLYVNKKGYQLALESGIINKNQLGKLKLQRVMKKCFFIAKKFYVGQIQIHQSFQNGCISQKQYQSLSKMQTHWTMKSKGINTNQSQKQISQLYQQCVYLYPLGIKVWNQFACLQKIFTIMMFQTVVWQKQRKNGYGVKRMKMDKRANMQFQRAPLSDGRSLPFSWEVFKIIRQNKIKIDIQYLRTLSEEDALVLQDKLM